MTKNEAVQVNLIYLIFKLVHFLVDTTDIKTTKTMRRQYRDLRDDTKMRIAQSLKGRSFSDSHKQAISDAMKAYWSTIPYRDEENNESNNQDNETSM